MKKGIIWIMLSWLIVAAFVLSSCGPAAPGEQEEEEEEEPVGQQEEERLEFAYVTIGDPGNLFVATTIRGWNEAIETFGAGTTVGSASGDYSKMIGFVEAAIAADVDGIFVFNWLDQSGLLPSYHKALENGIELVLMSSRPAEFTPEEVPFVGFLIEDQGYTTGQDMAARLKAAGLVSDVNIAFYAENAASIVATARRQGFLNALDDEGIGYIAGQMFEGGLDTAKSFDIVKAYLIAHPETDVIVGTGSTSTASSVMALQELGYEPGEILWTGFDLMPQIVEGIRAGYGASNVDEVFNYGFLGATTLYLRVKYGSIVGDLSIATVMVGQDNVEEFVD